MSGPLLSLPDALQAMLAPVRSLSVESVALEEAGGRVLAESLHAGAPMPPCDNSAMDGFAVHSADCREASAQQPTRLALVAPLHAGTTPLEPLTPGHAALITTGGLVPPGADAIAPVETCARDGDFVRVQAPVRHGDHVRHAGEDLQAGQIALPAGEVLTPARLCMAAALGRSHLCVHRRPVVAIAGSGDEIFALDAPMPAHGIRDSATHGLAAAARSAGALVRRLGVARDDPKAIRALLEAGLDADLLVTVAGVSVGERDFVREVLAGLGAEEKFWRVAIKPGKPVLLTTLGRTTILGLPGNPVSALLTFELFARPLLRRMAGHRALFPRPFPVTLTQSLRRLKERDHFVRVTLRFHESGWQATPTASQSSGVLMSVVQADGLAFIARGQGEVAAGATIPVFGQEGDWAYSERFEAGGE